jgi:pimeloyl-ACP methyl ester carboxylesterase
MPVYSGEPVCRTVDELASFVEGFIESRGYSSVSLVGNSLGGHVALLLTLKRPELVNTLTLTASSGLFEEGMGQGFIKRGDYSFIQERVAYTFYDPATATKELVDEVFGLVNDRMAAMRTLNLARDAQRENLRERLRKITCPVLLVWGLNDNITPTYVAHEFRKLIPRAEVRFIDHCGHAPMMEQPARFNHLLQRFLEKQLTPEITRQAA